MSLLGSRWLPRLFKRLWAGRDNLNLYDVKEFREFRDMQMYIVSTCRWRLLPRHAIKDEFVKAEEAEKTRMSI
jgi:hypothetical protein